MEQTVLINNVSFDLYDHYHTNDKAYIVVKNTTLDQLEAALGGWIVETVQIGDEYRGYNLAVSAIAKVFNQQIMDLYSVSFHSSNIERLIDQNTADIEIANGAIAELAELIGGEE